MVCNLAVALSEQGKSRALQRRSGGPEQAVLLGSRLHSGHLFSQRDSKVSQDTCENTFGKTKSHHPPAPNVSQFTYSTTEHGRHLALNPFLSFVFVV
jgi:hypothetical protein